MNWEIRRLRIKTVRALYYVNDSLSRKMISHGSRTNTQAGKRQDGVRNWEDGRGIWDVDLGLWNGTDKIREIISLIFCRHNGKNISIA